MTGDGIALILDEVRGIYIPRDFAKNFDMQVWGVSDEDRDILLEGPEHEHYWDAWGDVLGSAKATFDVNGAQRTFTLHQDGDLFRICPDLMTNEEYADFFDGEMKPAPAGSYEYEVCPDCLYYIAYGELPADSTKEEDARIGRGVDDLHREYEIVDPDGAEYGFSWAKCECCGGLAGDRCRVLCSKLKRKSDD